MAFPCAFYNASRCAVVFKSPFMFSSQFSRSLTLPNVVHDLLGVYCAFPFSFCMLSFALSYVLPCAFSISFSFVCPCALAVELSVFVLVRSVYYIVRSLFLLSFNFSNFRSQYACVTN